jgi:L-ascorbate metabolism protein UlaG (beta-lactamase superfamily)
MKLKWLGHSSFLITSEEEITIVTDPYEVGGGLSYGKIREAASIVTISHEHLDHNNAAAIMGTPEVVRGTGSKTVKGIEFRGIASYHDRSRGKERGPNTIFCFAVDEVKTCHLGDLGHQLDDKQIAAIGEVDVLFTPVGGFFTIDPLDAAQICDKLNPRVVIPMHYRNDKCTYPIARVDEFLKGRANVRRVDASEIELSAGQLPSPTETIVLKPAL